MIASCMAITLYRKQRNGIIPPLEAPIIGNNVSVGVGTKIIGNIKIGNNVKISSMSLVNKDINEENALYGGIPAKRLRDVKS